MKNCEYQQIDPRALTVTAGGQGSGVPGSGGGKDHCRSPAPRTPAAGKGGRRKWEVFPGKNRFYCDGRVILARQSGVLPLTLGLIVVTCGLFFAFDCPFLVDRLTVFIPVIGGLLFVFSVVALLQTSFTDPGILPRATPAEAADIERQIDTSGSSTYRPPPRTKEILINQQVVKLKYCFTCKMFRPPRTSHCSLCDNCVERFDHHCPWVGNCVGKRNYRFFYSFIISLSFLTSFIFGCVVTHLTLRSQEGRGLIQAITESPASVVELVICFFSIWSVLGLSGFHTYLVASNLTTNEDIKGSWSSKRGAEETGNPYTYNSIFTNCCVTLCGPMPPSLIDRRGFLPPDEALPTTSSSSDAELPPFMAKNDAHMCTQSTKDLLERMLRSPDAHSLCCPGVAPKTSPLGPDQSVTSSSSTTTSSSSTGEEPPSSSSSSLGCLKRQQHHIMGGAPSSSSSCPPAFGRTDDTRASSLHSINPAFRLASPSPSLSHRGGGPPLILGGGGDDAPDLGFVPLQ